ncbi:MAG: ADP-glyceromanno-heptose 6-epimerase [Desulfobacterales bacterium]|nr:ADP-glyceromanno-heptose 6-epimerase [Desulfobacterales bacterium]
MFIVTGGAGFIGSAVVWKLNLSGIDNILIVDNLGESEKWKNMVNRSYTDYMHKSAFLEAIRKKGFGKIEAIIHLGACSSTTERNAEYLMENNYHYSKAVAKYALENGIRLINASSAATYGSGEIGFTDDLLKLNQLKPLNMYGYTKHLFDLWALREKIFDKLVSLKFFNVFGPNEYHKGDMCSVIFKAFFQVKETGCIRLFKSYHPEYLHGGQQRDFVYVKDCVDLIGWLLENPGVNGLFNVGTGQARNWNDLAHAVFKAMKVPGKIEYIEMPQTLRDRYQYFTQAAMEKLAVAGCPLGFSSLEAAVGDYINNYLQQTDCYL